MGTHRTRRLRSGFQCLAVILGLLPVGSLGSQAIDEALALTRMTGAVVLDGVPDEAAWQSVPVLPLTALYPLFRSPLTERTEIRVAYDSLYLYASIIADDSEPSRVMANTLYRDRWIGDDEFALILDTFNDRENAMMFLVTPAGVRIDNLILNNAEPGRGNSINQDWNVQWEARARVGERGWTAEFRVPFTSLRYRSVGRETRMRMKAFRYLPRKGENQMFPETRPDDGPAPHFQPSLGQEIVLYDLPRSVPLFVTPYARVGGTDRTTSLDRTAGADVKVAVTPGLSLDVTLNTDFAQVEADDAQINLTRFSLFFPEKRPFFQERSGVFSLATGGNSTVFYSRRIGLDEQGRPRPIAAGARLAGNAGRVELGALAVRTAESRGSSGESFGVFRMRRALGRAGFLGGMATTRQADSELQSTLALDATVPLGRVTRFSSAVALSIDSTASGAGARNARVFAQLQRNVAGGRSFLLEYRASGAQYAPAIGFVQTAGFHEALVNVSHTWRNGPTRLIREHSAVIEAGGRHRTADHRPDQISSRAGWSFSTRGNWSGGFRIGGQHEHVPTAFPLTDRIEIAAGSYTVGRAQAFVGTPFDRRLRGEARIERSGLFGGQTTTLAIEPIWSHSRNLELSATVARTILEFSEHRREAQDLVRGRVRLAFSARWFAESFVQLNSASDQLTSNLRVRFNPAEGHDLWVAVDSRRSSVAPTDVAFIVKYSRMFTLDLRRRIR